jgi:hypothetical protein
LNGKIHPSVFVSYSWDSEEHQTWVQKFVNDLRSEYGMNATMDIFETQMETVNLNSMMISHIRDSDYVIIILTEKYKNKAELEKGGVGFETMLSIPQIKENKDRFIFIVKHEGHLDDAIPTYLKGFYAFSFSDESLYEENIEKLSYRIYNKEYYEKVPLGKIPDFKKKKEEKNNRSVLSKYLDEEQINRIIPITDFEKDEYIEKIFKDLISILRELLDEVEEKNKVFTYRYEPVNNKKAIFRFYVNGNNRRGLKIWLGSFGSSTSNINISNSFDLDSDSSMNEIISCKIENNELKLSMMMNTLGKSNLENTNDLVRNIWKRFIADKIN